MSETFQVSKASISLQSHPKYYKDITGYGTAGGVLKFQHTYCITLYLLLNLIIDMTCTYKVLINICITKKYHNMIQHAQEIQNEQKGITQQEGAGLL